MYVPETETPDRPLAVPLATKKQSDNVVAHTSFITREQFLHLFGLLRRPPQIFNRNLARLYYQATHIFVSINNRGGVVAVKGSNHYFVGSHCGCQYVRHFISAEGLTDLPA